MGAIAQTLNGIPGPAKGTRITETYARMVAREAYFWAWPMVNIFNRRQAFKQAPEPGLMNGVLPFAPLNRLSMLHDYIEPSQRWVACPNQDVVYGSAVAALDTSAVVIQVPDFGTRFWVYQVVDLRTDSFADLGAMYATQPGFYMLAGPRWKGEKPRGVTEIFASRTNTAFVVPRVFQDDTAEDKRAVQAVINGIDVYPLAEYDGNMRSRNWRGLRNLGSPDGQSGQAESRWVFPERFFDDLPQVLRDATPLPGEEATYLEVLSVIAAAQKDPAMKRAMIDEATHAENELIDPLLQFRNFGIPLPHYWTTETNGAQFGTDYFMRTAIARSNILVNKPNETKYFYQDLDADGQRLNGRHCYAVTFARTALPPVKGFWSLTLYDEYHFFVPNLIKRFSVGTKNKDLVTGSDDSLTIYVQSREPQTAIERANWLPAPEGDFSLYLRAYWPEAPVVDGRWTPPAVERR